MALKEILVDGVPLEGSQLAHYAYLEQQRGGHAENARLTRVHAQWGVVSSLGAGLCWMLGYQQGLVLLLVPTALAVLALGIARVFRPNHDAYWVKMIGMMFEEARLLAEKRRLDSMLERVMAQDEAKQAELTDLTRIHNELVRELGRPHLAIVEPPPDAPGGGDQGA